MSSSSTRSSRTQVKCDKCDGPHASGDCPWFNGQARGNHTDAQPLPPEERPTPSTNEPTVRAQGCIEPMPMDGSCLFHSLDYGLGVLHVPTPGARQLRTDLAVWAYKNGGLRICGSSVNQWRQWEGSRQESMQQYAKRMSTTNAWGGVVEIISCVMSRCVDVAVWVPASRQGWFQRTAYFPACGATLGWCFAVSSNVVPSTLLPPCKLMYACTYVPSLQHRPVLQGIVPL